MRAARLAVVTAALGVLLIAPALTGPADADSVCVRVGTTCYSSLPAALRAAKDGDTVRIPAGTFPGGVSITKSITVIGAGAGRTVLSGGGPVLTIGVPDAKTEPTVTVQGVTLRDGITDNDGFGDTFVAVGGGLEIPASAKNGPGATVTVVDSVITGNRAVPSTQFHFQPGDEGAPQCPSGPCPFAGAFGGGIGNSGALTLRGTTVSQNLATGVLTSDADGGGIYNAGSLVLDGSSVSDNHALAGDKWGRFAEGGGIYNDGFSARALTLRNTTVSSNESELRSSFPTILADGTTLDMIANGGGVSANVDFPVTVVGSHIDHNRTAFIGPNATDSDTSSDAINSGLWVGTGRLLMRNSSVDGNQLLVSARTAAVGPGGAMEWDGRADISGSEFNSNRVDVRASNGDANAVGAVGAIAISVQGKDPGQATVRDSVIRDNVTTVTAKQGDAEIFGGGLLTDSSLLLSNVTVANNRSTADSRTATLQGGGIWNGPFLGVSKPASKLTAQHSAITGNVLQGPSGATRQGAGLFTAVPATLTGVRITGNRPDQCFGCTAGPAAAR